MCPRPALLRPSKRLQGEGATNPNCLRNLHTKIVFPEMTVIKQNLGGRDGLVNSLHVKMDFSTRDGADRPRPANSWKLAVMRHKQSNLKITSLAFRINTALLSACTWPVRLGPGASGVLGPF